MTRKQKVTNFLMILVVVVCAAIMGCQSALDQVTPTPVITGANEYTEMEIPQWHGWTTLHNIKEQAKQMVITHVEAQIKLSRCMEDDKRYFGRLKNIADTNIQQAQQWQDLMVGTMGNEFPLIGLLGSTMLGGLAGNAIGARKKRNGDLDPVEVENEKKLAIETALAEAGLKAKLTVETAENTETS